MTLPNNPTRLRVHREWIAGRQVYHKDTSMTATKYATLEERKEARRQRDARRKAYTKEVLDAARQSEAARGMPSDDEREEYRQKALFKLRFVVLPALESVIAGTPTGPQRDRLTDANVILQLVADEKPNPALDEPTAAEVQQALFSAFEEAGSNPVQLPQQDTSTR